eukprot:PLAT809.2.p1 GENE.PLAT809.2~~PLAT809.2.p1  ORF type:complete len:818 (+),score=331.24 PLAT809.2:24-2477(+)
MSDLDTATAEPASAEPAAAAAAEDVEAAASGSDGARAAEAAREARRLAEWESGRRRVAERGKVQLSSLGVQAVALAGTLAVSALAVPALQLGRASSVPGWSQAMRALLFAVNTVFWSFLTVLVWHNAAPQLLDRAARWRLGGGCALVMLAVGIPRAAVSPADYAQTGEPQPNNAAFNMLTTLNAIAIGGSLFIVVPFVYWRASKKRSEQVSHVEMAAMPAPAAAAAASAGAVPSAVSAPDSSSTFAGAPPGSDKKPPLPMLGHLIESGSSIDSSGGSDGGSPRTLRSTSSRTASHGDGSEDGKLPIAPAPLPLPGSLEVLELDEFDTRRSVASPPGDDDGMDADEGEDEEEEEADGDDCELDAAVEGEDVDDDTTALLHSSAEHSPGMGDDADEIRSAAAAAAAATAGDGSDGSEDGHGAAGKPVMDSATALEARRAARRRKAKKRKRKRKRKRHETSLNLASMAVLPESEILGRVGYGDRIHFVSKGMLATACVTALLGYGGLIEAFWGSGFVLSLSSLFLVFWLVMLVLDRKSRRAGRMKADFGYIMEFTFEVVAVGQAVQSVFSAVFGFFHGHPLETFLVLLTIRIQWFALKYLLNIHALAVFHTEEYFDGIFTVQYFEELSTELAFLSTDLSSIPALVLSLLLLTMMHVNRTLLVLDDWKERIWRHFWGMDDETAGESEARFHRKYRLSGQAIVVERVAGIVIPALLAMDVLYNVGSPAFTLLLQLDGKVWEQIGLYVVLTVWTNAVDGVVHRFNAKYVARREQSLARPVDNSYLQRGFWKYMAILLMATVDIAQRLVVVQAVRLRLARGESV